MIGLNKHSLVVSPLRFVLLFVFVLVPLIGFITVLKAAEEGTAELNIGQSMKVLDPFSLGIISASEKEKKWIVHPVHPGDGIILPPKARPRSPFIPGPR